MSKQNNPVRLGKNAKLFMSIAQIRPSFAGSTLGDSLKPRQLLISWNTSRRYGPCSCRFVSGKVSPSKVKGFA